MQHVVLLMAHRSSKTGLVNVEYIIALKEMADDRCGMTTVGSGCLWCIFELDVCNFSKETSELD